jgi:hypothetical protein
MSKEKRIIMNVQDLINSIQAETEWLQSTQEDDVECISLESLEGILSRYFEFKIKLTQQ